MLRHLARAAAGTNQCEKIFNRLGRARPTWEVAEEARSHECAHQIHSAGKASARKQNKAAGFSKSVVCIFSNFRIIEKDVKI